MLHYDRKQRKYKLYPYEVTYTNKGVEHTQWALPDKEWWLATAEKHDDINIIEFKEFNITPKIQERFDSIKNWEYEIALEYILGGEVTQEQVDYLLGVTKELPSVE